MTKEIFYTTDNNLIEKIKDKKLIPYRITPRVKYESNRWYYNDYWRQCFKVISVAYDNNGFLQEAYIKWDDDNYGLICTELDIHDLRLEKDYKCIHNENIINNDKKYTGAEIVYWFFINGINCFNNKYSGFWKFIDTFSAHRISDYARYKLIANYDEKNDVYKDCKVIRVR